MKLLATSLILIALCGFLAYTNPTMDGYDHFINQRIVEKTRQADTPIEGMIGSVLGGFAAKLMAQQTMRKDYFIFSTYDTAVGNKHIRSIGVMNHFYVTDDQVFQD
jgi:hypothetical protein